MASRIDSIGPEGGHIRGAEPSTVDANEAVVKEFPAALRLEGINKRFGSAVAANDVSLTIGTGEFFTFLGSSGSGKSTILRMVAGLETPDSGRVILDGEDIAAVPPWRRRIGMVFQQYALFPHMNVEDNVSYGLRLRKVRKQEMKERVDQLLDLVGLSGFHDRKVTQLSGGEQQRVALARALAPRPALLLLDEPLGALDEKVRRQMQSELKRIQASTRTTFLYVTHDQEEALTMSNRIAIFHHGVMEQCAKPDDVFYRPRNQFVASFFRGWNLLQVEPSPSRSGSPTLGGTPLALGGEELDASTTVGLRAEHVRVGPTARNHDVRLRAHVVDVQYRGSLVDHLVRLTDGQDLTATSTVRHMVEADDEIDIGFDLKHVVVLPD